MRSGKTENYGVVKEIIEQAADSLADSIMDLKRRTELLEFGRSSWKAIDQIMKKEFGRNVRDYWESQSQVYKSMLRRRVWERTMAKVNERVGTRTSRSARQTTRLTSLESLLSAVEERR